MVYVLLILGFACLIKGADFFVDGCSGLARKFHVPTIIIGLTVVAMGTSLPELAISVSAAIRGIDGMAVSNIIGSNIFNLLMVCGCCAAAAPLTVQAESLKKQMPFTILITVLLLGLGVRGMSIGRTDGLILLAIFVCFLWTTVRKAKKSMDEIETEEDTGFTWWKCLLCLAGGGAAIAVGGQLVVSSAEEIAAGFGLSETLIGLTVCAIGTSLPELVTSMVATRKGEDDMAFGNVIGSCLFNILMILGITSAIRPMEFLTENIMDLLILIAFSAAILLMMFPKKRLNRGCGICCIGLYAVYMVYICIR